MHGSVHDAAAPGPCGPRDGRVARRGGAWWEAREAGGAGTLNLPAIRRPVDPMTTRTSTGRARRALLGAALALALPLAACGSDSTGDAGPDPATAVPASAAVYVEATVRPEGDLREDTLKVAGKVLNTDKPEEQLQSLLRQAGGEFEIGSLDYQQDLEPWLGPRVGVFVTELRDDRDAQGAVVLAATDTDKAKESMDKAAREPAKAGAPAPKVATESYNGATLTLSDDDRATTVVDDFAILGSPDGVKAAVDAVSSDGTSLADADAFTQATDALGDEDELLGSLYVDVQAVIDQSVASGEVEKDDAAAARQVFASTGFSTVAAGLSVGDDALRVDVASQLTKAQPDLGNPSQAVAALPGDSWMALGIGDLQKVAEYQLSQLSTVTALGGNADINQLIEQLNRQLRIDIREDLLSWMGEGAAFVRGTSLVDIGGAIVVQVKDAAKAKAAMPDIERLVKELGGRRLTLGPLSAPGVDAGFTVRTENFPLPINVALAGDRLVVAVTDPALQAAISPQGSLGDNDDFKAAAEALGDGIQPSVYVAFAPVLALVEGFGLGQDADFQRFKQAAEQLRALAAGGSSDDKTSRQRAVLTLKGDD